MRHGKMHFGGRPFALAFIAIVFGASAVCAQTTSFTYQGRLNDGGTAANGNYDLQFRLWDSNSGGTQIDAPQSLSNVAVSAGVFTVTLDFGAAAFPGTPRWLEISARLSGTASFISLSPRQQITSTPYAIRSFSASAADTVTVNGVPPGSGNYIQNSTTPQAGANFNISGNGTAGGTLSSNIVNATTQYNIGGSRMLSSNAGSLFAGFGAGAANTTGGQNAFFGSDAGSSNKTGGFNAFFGTSAGISNTTGSGNAFFGSVGFSNSAGSNITLIGVGADVGADNLDHATAIGGGAVVSSSNSIVLGRADTDNVGIGTTSPTATLDIRVNSALIRFSGVNCGSDFGAITFGNVALGCNNYSLLGEGVNTFINRPAGGFITFRENNNDQMVIKPGGKVGIGTAAPDQTLTVNGNASKPGGGSWAVFSDERLKNITGRFTPGLKAVMQLKPLRYEYKPGNALGLDSPGEHVGFSAQAVQRIIPEAVSKNDKGYLLVNNDPILWTMLNAVKEQQSQIEQQRALIEQERLRVTQQQRQIESLKKLVCASHRHAAICN